jgi:hypothetical protein
MRLVNVLYSAVFRTHSRLFEEHQEASDVLATLHWHGGAIFGHAEPKFSPKLLRI